MATDELHHWLHERLPAALMAAPPEIAPYDDELVVMLTLAAELPEGGEARREAAEQTITRLREETRTLRMRLARELQSRSGLPVAWGMRLAEFEVLFTTRSAPVMTRLGRAERDVLDLLVASGIADTRSAALSYIVRVFAHEHADWLAEARHAVLQIARVREQLKITRRSGPPETGG